MSVTGKNEIKNRNASPSAYGWAFQVGAGIKLMLENITEFTALKMEGKNDDIELSLPSGKIYAQAKSVTVMGDQSSATEKLKKALETLSDDATKDNNSIKLIYITNILNPFSSSLQNSPYYNCYDTSYNYSILPAEDREKIRKIVGDDFPVEQLQVHVVRFFGEDKNKFDGIKEYIKSFARKVFDDASYSDLLLEKWCTLFLANAADVPKEDLRLSMNKKEALYPVIILAIDNPASCSEFQKVCNYDDYDGVVESFKNLINQRSAEYDFSTASLGDYTIHKSRIPTVEESSKFKYKYVIEHWQDYEKWFSEIKDAEKREAVTKLTLLTIIVRAVKLLNVKKVTNL